MKVGVFIKKFVFVIMTIFLICINSISVLADEQKLFDLPDFSHLVGDNQYYTISIYNRDKDISEWKVYLRVLDNNLIKWSVSDKRLNYKDGSWDYYCYQGDTEWEPDGFTSNPAFVAEHVEYSSCDLVKYDSNEVLFQRAPIQAMGAIPVTIFHLRKIQKTMVYLVPYLIALVIGLVAFRKVWNWLKIQLSNL